MAAEYLRSVQASLSSFSLKTQENTSFLPRLDVVLRVFATPRDANLVAFEPWQPHGARRPWKTRLSLPSLGKVEV